MWIPLLALALAIAGCAHQPPMPAEQVSADRAGTKDRSETDPRYTLPPAKDRSLTIFLGSQTFEYVEDDRIVASGAISSGSAAHPTPAGNFRVLSKDKDKRSGKYTNYFDQNTPMPYSLQFYGPYFIHEGWVPGYPDSHGCVRLHYEDARLLFARIRVGDRVLVKQEGSARPISPWSDLPLVF
jgi:lipoprotein-anchoring transpeptidase ErfK/SrfK